MSSQPKVFAVLPAAGSGERFGQQKQFCQILGFPLFRYALDAFQRISWISKIFIVIPEDKVDSVKSSLKSDRVCVISGAITRHGSIQAAFRHFDDQPDFVVVHDAVRPVVEEAVLKALLDRAKDSGASGACRLLVSTILDVVSSSPEISYPPRSDFVCSETPQVFRGSVFRCMCESLSQEDLTFGTECLQLAQRYSHVNAVLLPVSDKYFKVTHETDLWAAERLIKGRSLDYWVLVASDTCDCQQFQRDIIRQFSSVDVAVVRSSCLSELVTTVSTSAATTLVIIVENLEDYDCSQLLQQMADQLSRKSDFWPGVTIAIIVTGPTRLKLPTSLLETLAQMGIVVHMVESHLEEKRLVKVIERLVIGRETNLSGLLTVLTKQDDEQHEHVKAIRKGDVMDVTSHKDSH